MAVAEQRASLGVRFARWWQGFFYQWQLQIMVLPGIIFMIIFNYIPIYGLVLAFKNYTVVDTIGDAPWIGLDNFKIILGDSYFWDSVVNTLGISVIKLVLGFILPIILAVMIYEVPWKPFKKIVQTITYLPHFFSWIILGGMLISWLSSNGLLNSTLHVFGIDAGANYLLDADKYWGIASLSDVWKEAGWGTILYLATMAGIDQSLYEAAELDGASKIKRIWHITLPGISNMITLNLILSVSGILNSNLDQTLVLMNSQNQSKAEVINSYVYRMGMTQGDFSYATAVGLGISIISAILLVVTNAVTKKINDNQSVL
ncbi:protein lplB [Bifidobacterium ramosum]|uniref:ABC transporter permease subunit n=2 Tax=Bifidobacterium TaxID=1678 RepID=A0A6L4X318_9BIFI|nr:MULTISPECIES: ABC transporter permease subunit [Bifidobacterium]KAB8289106.1 protein lplB [Bifidobacterium ramosum]KFI49460.1 ABC transporter, permease protein [Bifidobacterium biavatii DSM 23969]NEG70819.1 ABC transporter permease subunit [Bifidobacterium ramosum]